MGNVAPGQGAMTVFRLRAGGTVPVSQGWSRCRRPATTAARRRPSAAPATRARRVRGRRTPRRSWRMPRREPAPDAPEPAPAEPPPAGTSEGGPSPGGDARLGRRTRARGSRDAGPGSFAPEASAAFTESAVTASDAAITARPDSGVDAGVGVRSSRRAARATSPSRHREDRWVSRRSRRACRRRRP